MNIEEMHVTFRELAQQMGMQTTRAILPEDVDICLNTAIMDVVKGIIASNVGFAPYNDKIAKNNSAVSSINGLRTLYRKANVEESLLVGEGTEVNPFNFELNSSSIMLYLGFKVSYDGSTLFDCRIIDNEDLGQTIRDYCNRPTKDSPICAIVGDKDKMTVEIITGRNKMVKPNIIQYLYIVEPAKVYYDEDDSNNNIDCDLPEYLHIEVVKQAISIYLQSIGAIRSTNKNNN